MLGWRSFVYARAIAALASCALLATTGTARASREGEMLNLNGPFETLYVGAGVGALLTFGVADLVYFTQGRWLPPEWATGQMVSAAPLGLFGLSYALGSYDGQRALGYTFLISSPIYLALGAMSLELYREPLPQPGVARAPVSLSIAVVPIDHGVASLWTVKL